MSTMNSACLDCGARLRPSRVTLANAPGTKVLGGGGKCAACWDRAKKCGAVRVVREPAQLAKFDHRLAAVALEGYLAERRKRLGRVA